MTNETENILSILRKHLEDKDKQIENLTLLVNDLRQNKIVNGNVQNEGDSCEFGSNDDIANVSVCNVECCQCSCHKLSKSESCTQTFETDFHATDFTGSTLDWTPEEGVNVTVADLIKEVVDSSSTQNDYVYDEASKMYYSPSTGYYYDWERNLLYDPYSRTYYTYDSKKNSYEFCYQFESQNDEHSQDFTQQVAQKVSELNLSDVSPTRTNDTVYQIYRKPKKKEKKGKKKKHIKMVKNVPRMTPRRKISNIDDKKLRHNSCSSLEDGEIRSSSSGCDEVSSDDETFVDSHIVPETNEDGWPPCIRAVVKESSYQKIGSLFLIPCTGGVIGRDKGNSICVPDISISRAHARISFDKETWTYYISDLGSQNGTFINDTKLMMDSNQSSHSLKHGDMLALGCCKLLIHIHPGSSTCNECEPGLVQAELAENQEKSSVFKSREEKEKDRRQKLKQIKKKFGLENSDYVDGEKTLNLKSQGYQDRAQTRRKVIGSQNPYEKDAPPSSVSTPISSCNKGYQMLKKMGWQDGSSIGVTDTANVNPIEISFRNTRAGLGSDAIEQVSIPEDLRRKKWKKAQKRYQDLYGKIDDDDD